MSDARIKVEPGKNMFLQLEGPPSDFGGALLGFVVGLPILLILGLLYVLLSPIFTRLWMRKERRFAARMAELGRSTSWNDVREAINAGRGTIISECWTNYARLWWTPNDVAVECPQVLYDCDGEQGEEAIKAYALVRAQYCDADNGSALLVPPDETEVAWTEMQNLEKRGRCVSLLIWLTPSASS